MDLEWIRENAFQLEPIDPNSKVPYSVCFEEKITIMVRKILKKILSPVVREMVKQELKSLEETISRQVVSTVANVVSSATIENFDSDN